MWRFARAVSLAVGLVVPAAAGGQASTKAAS